MILLSTSDLVFIVFYRLVIFQQDQRMAINASVATVNCLLLSIDQLYKVVTVDNAQWESAQPNLDLPKIEARSEVSA